MIQTLMSVPESRTMHQLLREQAARDPLRPVVLTATGSTDYQTLSVRAQRVATYLQQAGVTRGDRVGLLCDNRSEWLEIFFGISWIGAIVVPFSTWSTLAELDFLIKDSGVTTVFTVTELGERNYLNDWLYFANSLEHPALQNLIAIDPVKDSDTQSLQSYESLLIQTNPDDIKNVAEPEDVLAVLYTSGSSNRPKAVPLLHRDAIENGFNIGERQGLVTSDRILIAIPLFWSYGAVNALPATLTHGATMVLQARFEPGGALDLIEQHQCTALYTLPAMSNAMLSHKQFSPTRTASLRTGVTIGAPQDIIKVAQELGATDICNIYGSTETYGNCCVTPHDWPLERRSVCQGSPLPGVTVRIRDRETGEMCGAGIVGDIEVCGYLTPGYDGDSARHNAQTFTTDGYFKTGDLGSLDAEGVFTYAGRSSEMIKRSGINVSPAEVEETLQQHPSVGLAAVTGVDDEARGEVIVAYIAVKPDVLLDKQALLEHCRGLLSRYKVPDYIIGCDTLPLTVTGKLMRRELKQMAIKAVAEIKDSPRECAGESGS